MDPSDPVEDRLMRESEHARNLAQACTRFVHLQCVPLVRTAERAAFGFTDELFEAADLAFRGALGGGVVKELRRTGAPMIVRPHVARSAECDEVFERVVAGEPKWLHVVNVERAPVVFRSFPASTADLITLAHFSLDGFPA